PEGPDAPRPRRPDEGRHGRNGRRRHGRDAMIDHLSVGVADIAKAKAFYDAVLKTLDCTCIFTVDIPGQGVVAHGYGEIGSDHPRFWIGVPEKLDNGANAKGGAH